ncbi:exoribonuclease II [Pantoea sp. Mhis]|uniref:exoribonuclease II n=1 Tax=Pantoea sp. Mhis TaxID=2576759 RepID=UPI001357465F|nr:exoribonuclease II [Pantoea sp. Mhis]MXP56197.1 exoribonuclease II [Pantoea sp. Mhis]
MLQNNPLLIHLKQKLHTQTLRVEGVVKCTEKNFGFLEIDTQKSYFIPPLQMKKVMHGDRIIAVIHTNKDRENAEPETLIEPFLTRFVGRIYKQYSGRLSIIPDHPLLNNHVIQCYAMNSLKQNFQNGDWAVAEMRNHPLKEKRNFYAELIEFITNADDNFAPWWVTLSRYNLEREAPNVSCGEMIDQNEYERTDLTSLSFITIDKANTKDIDDALHISETIEGNLLLTIAIADPTAYIKEGSEVDQLASQRAFTNYLPGFNIPMLPRKLSDDICSLHPNMRRSALVCSVTVFKNGNIGNDIKFFVAWIKSKAKLVYDEVSDWLENNGNWQPENHIVAEQIILLHRLCLIRSKWRQHYALVFKDRPDYSFVIGKQGEVLDILVEPRRIANRVIEEAMILANICAAKILKEKLGFGIYNLHNGFETTNAEQAANLLAEYGIITDYTSIMTLEGFCNLHRLLDLQTTKYLNNRLRKFQSFTEFSTKPGPHFALGLDAYATWTSPIRKFGDIINHRLLKAIIRGACINPPNNATVITISERRRLNRLAERDIVNWLHVIFLTKFIGNEHNFNAEIIDILRGGMRVRLQENGAIAFVPALFIHSIRNEIELSQEYGLIRIKGKVMYSVTDIIKVNIVEIRTTTRNIIVRPVINL